MLIRLIWNSNWRDAAMHCDCEMYQQKAILDCSGKVDVSGWGKIIWHGTEKAIVDFEYKKKYLTNAEAIPQSKQRKQCFHKENKAIVISNFCCHHKLFREFSYLSSFENRRRIT